MTQVLDGQRQHSTTDQHGTGDREWNPHRVLVGVDESLAGTAALRWAAGEAWRRGALLTAARAIPSPQSPAGALDQLRLGAARKLRETVHAVTGARQATETLVLDGDPADGLVGLSQETELLVLGRISGRRRAAGSVIGYCLLHAHCPVVVVSEEEQDDLGTPAPVKTRSLSCRRPPVTGLALA